MCVCVKMLYRKRESDKCIALVCVHLHSQSHQVCIESVFSVFVVVAHLMALIKRRKKRRPGHGTRRDAPSFFLFLFIFNLYMYILLYIFSVFFFLLFFWWWWCCVLCAVSVIYKPAPRAYNFLTFTSLVVSGCALRSECGCVRCLLV